MRFLFSFDSAHKNILYIQYAQKYTIRYKFFELDIFFIKLAIRDILTKALNSYTKRDITETVKNIYIKCKSFALFFTIVKGVSVKYICGDMVILWILFE